MKTLELTYRNADNGNCRVYYKTKKGERSIGLCCLQLTGQTEFELLACSQDGEPSHPIPFESVATIEAPTGDERIERQLRDWLEGKRPEPLTPEEQAEADLAAILDLWQQDIADAERKLAANILVEKGYILAHDAITAVTRVDEQDNLGLRAVPGHLTGVPHMTKEEAELAAKRWNEEMAPLAAEYGVGAESLSVYPIHYRDFLKSAVEKWREMVGWVEARTQEGTK